MVPCMDTSKCANPTVWRASVISYHNLICTLRWMLRDFACVSKQSEQAVARMSAYTQAEGGGEPSFVHPALKRSVRQLQDPTDVQREAMVANGSTHRQFQTLTQGEEEIGSGKSKTSPFQGTGGQEQKMKMLHISMILNTAYMY